MNGQTAKLLKKLAKKSGLPYKRFKSYYKGLNSEQRKALLEETREILEEK